LINDGEYLLEKKYISIKKEEDKVKDILNNKMPTKTEEKNIFKMYLKKGSFSGLEIIFNEKMNYECTLKSLSNLNMIFKINLNHINNLNSKIRNYLQKYYNSKKEIIKNLINSKNNFYSKKIHNEADSEIEKKCLNIDTQKIGNIGFILKEKKEIKNMSEYLTSFLQKSSKHFSMKKFFTGIKRNKILKPDISKETYSIPKAKSLYENLMNKDLNRKNSLINKPIKETNTFKVYEEKTNLIEKKDDYDRCENKILKTPKKKMTEKIFIFEINKDLKIYENSDNTSTNYFNTTRNGFNSTSFKMSENLQTSKTEKKINENNISRFSNENFKSFLKNNNSSINSICNLNENRKKEISINNNDFSIKYSRNITYKFDDYSKKFTTRDDIVKIFCPKESNICKKLSSINKNRKNSLFFDKNVKNIKSVNFNNNFIENVSEKKSLSIKNNDKFNFLNRKEFGTSNFHVIPDNNTSNSNKDDIKIKSPSSKKDDIKIKSPCSNKNEHDFSNYLFSKNNYDKFKNNIVSGNKNFKDDLEKNYGKYAKIIDNIVSPIKIKDKNKEFINSTSRELIHEALDVSKLNINFKNLFSPIFNSNNYFNISNSKTILKSKIFFKNKEENNSLYDKSILKREINKILPFKLDIEEDKFSRVNIDTNQKNRENKELDF